MREVLVNAQQRLQLLHRQPRRSKLLSRRQFNRWLGNRGRLGHVASFDPLQVSGVVGVGGVRGDEGVVRKAEDAVGGDKLVGHGLKLGGENAIK